MNEKSFLEQGRKRVVEIIRLRETPEFSDGAWCITSRPKEVGDHTKTTKNLFESGPGRQKTFD